MSHHVIAVMRQEWLRSFIRVGMLALATLLLLALRSSAQAKTFDQAVADALRSRRGDPPACGNAARNLAVICNNAQGNNRPGDSGGSTTALSREITPVEERKVRRLIGPLSLFISGTYERFDKDETTFEPGHTTDTWRATFGADYSVNNRFVVGGAFNYANDNGQFNPGGRFDTDSYGGLLHVIFVPAPKSFITAVAGYMWKDYFISRTVSFDNVPDASGTPTGDTDGNEFKVGVDGGYDFTFQNVTIGPRLGLHYKHTRIDGYRERGNTGLELVYDNQTDKSLTSVLGMYGSIAISTSFGVLIPQTTVEYVHEFEDNQRTITFSFVEDLNRRRFTFQNDPPDRNYFNIGVGMVAVLPHGFSPFVNYRALVGYQDQSSHAVTAGLRIEF